MSSLSTSESAGPRYGRSMDGNRARSREWAPATGRRDPVHGYMRQPWDAKGDSFDSGAASGRIAVETGL